MRINHDRLIRLSCREYPPQYTAYQEENDHDPYIEFKAEYHADEKIDQPESSEWDYDAYDDQKCCKQTNCEFIHVKTPLMI